MLVYQYRGIDLVTSTSGTLHDEFVQADDASTDRLAADSGRYQSSQSWTSGSNPSEVTGVVARIAPGTSGSAPGLVRASIYAHSGVYGTSSVPTGAALVSSPWYATDQITTATNYWFPMSGWTPSASTNYCLVVESDAPLSSVTYGFKVVKEDGAAATHGGNQATLGTSWTSDSADDMAFKVYYTSGGGDDFELRLRDGTYRRRLSWAGA